jgi:spore germination protein KC
MKGHSRWMLGLVLGLVFFLQGCGDMKDLLSLNFATALGLDYQKGQYIGYLQSVNFGNVAKVEGGYPGEPTMYVAKGVGPTPDAAISSIMNTSQQEVYLKHVSAILLSENVIKKGYNDIYDSLSRHPEFTLSPWIFGTREPLDKILTVPGFYNMTSLQTILHKPLVIFQQHSVLKPKQMFEFHREFFEPNYTTYIPSLKIAPNQWKKNQKKEPKLAYDGAFFIKNQYYKGYYPLNELKGLKWALKDTVRIHVTTGSFTVNVQPSVNIKETKTDPHPALMISVKGKGILFERIDNESSRLDTVE